MTHTCIAEREQVEVVVAAVLKRLSGAIDPECSYCAAQAREWRKLKEAEIHRLLWPEKEGE